MIKQNDADEFTMHLKEPITKEQMDAITDAELEHTTRLFLTTPKGKIVEFVKVVRCVNCRYAIKKGGNTMLCCFDNVRGSMKHVFDFCSDGKKKDDQ